MHIADELRAIAPQSLLEITPVGSRVTCDPPPEGTDEDYLVLASDQDMFLVDAWGVGFDGAADDDSSYEETPFLSLRRGDVNLIVTDSIEFYRRFLAATGEAKRRNLLRKEDRIALFAKILYPGLGDRAISFLKGESP